VDSPWWRVKLRVYSSCGITIMNTQAWPGGRCCERRPVELRVACQGNYREARSIALMAGFEASLSYSVQVLPKHSHLRSCERTRCKSVHNSQCEESFVLSWMDGMQLTWRYCESSQVSDRSHLTLVYGRDGPRLQIKAVNARTQSLALFERVICWSTLIA
jgi:hypothetical protein